MGEHEEDVIRESVVGNLPDNGCLGSDNFGRDLTLNVHSHSFPADTLIYVQVNALSYDICRFAPASGEESANILTTKEKSGND